jgi:hypothetical protein
MATPKLKGRAMTKDQMRHALNVIYDQIFNQGERRWAGLLWVIRDRGCGVCLLFDVRSASKATGTGAGPGALYSAGRL